MAGRSFDHLLFDLKDDGDCTGCVTAGSSVFHDLDETFVGFWSILSLDILRVGGVELYLSW